VTGYKPRWSPIQVLTGPNVEQLHWRDQRVTAKPRSTSDYCHQPVKVKWPKWSICWLHQHVFHIHQQILCSATSTVKH